MLMQLDVSIKEIVTDKAYLKVGFYGNEVDLGLMNAHCRGVNSFERYRLEAR